jgi:hypothetical protein
MDSNMTKFKEIAECVDSIKIWKRMSLNI